MSIITMLRLVILFVGTLALSCSNVQEQDLYGTYFAKYEFGTETLILHANGKYDQIVEITKTAESFKGQGKWTYLSRFSEIDLENAYCVQDGFGDLDPNYNVPSSGRTLMGIYQLFPWSPIRLGSDELVQLVKQSEDDRKGNN